MSSLQNLVRKIGVKGITKATEERFLQLLLDADDDHPVLTNHVTHLASTDMYFLEEIVSCSGLVASEPEFVTGLLRAALLRANNRNRVFINRIAIKAELAGRLPRGVDDALTSLTPSQQGVFEKLRDMADTYFHHVRSPRDPVQLRLTPLLIGCSGVGKSHLARMLAREFNARIVELTVGSWVPHGAKQSPTTIETLTDLLAHEAPLVVFLDELDKHRAQDNTWALGLTAEMFALLDRSLVGGADWTPDHSRRLREKTFVIGAGTWSDTWKHSIGKTIGFGTPQFDLDEVRAKVQRAELIPDELMNRFSSDWQIIAPYSVEDFEAIATRLNLSREVLDPVRAAESGRNFRFVEDCVTRAAIAARKRERTRQIQMAEPANDFVEAERSSEVA